MEVAKPFALDHFTSFLPCHFSLSSDLKQHRCMLNLEITKNFVKFNLYNQGSKDLISSQFDFEKYDVLLVSQLYCIFVNLCNQSSATFYFLPENSNEMMNNNLRRFVFALADAGMLSYDPNDSLSEVYKNFFIFRFIPEHSFVPDGLYSYIYSVIYRNVRAICLSRVKSVMRMKESPFNPKYLNFIIPSIQVIEKQRISSTKSNKKSKYESNFLFLHQIKIIHKVLEKSNEDDIYNIFKAQINNIKDSRFKIIESDCREINQLIQKKKSSFYLTQIDTEKWNDKLSLICTNVCKVHILSDNSSYYKNDFLIAMRIALFLKNGEKLENLEEYSLNDKCDDEVKTFKSKLNALSSNKTDDEFEIMVYFIYKALMSGLTSDIVHNLAYNFCMNIFECFAPSAKAFFVFKQIRTFDFIEKDVKELFVNTLKSPWIFWFFILKTNCPEKAYQSLIASVIYNIVPILVNHNINDEDSISEYWPNIKKKFQSDVQMIQNILDVATYIYDGSAVTNAF